MQVSFYNLFVNKFLVAVLFVVGGYFVYKFLGLLIDRFVHKIDPDAPYGLTTFDQRVFTLAEFLKHLLRFGVIVFVLVLILAQFFANAGSLAVFLGLLIAGLSFGLQELIRDFVIGFFVFFENQYQVDDEVEINGLPGVVEKINLRTTFLRGHAGEQIIIPNHLIKEIKNFSKGPVKIAIKIGFAEETLEAGRLAISKTVEEFQQKNSTLLEEKPKISQLDKISEKFNGLKIEFKAPHKERGELIRNFKKALEENLAREEINYIYIS